MATPGLQWSSNDDGDDVWIEIALSGPTNIQTIGFWTRTMGTSAQISSFKIVTETGEEHGPFTLDNANVIHYFNTDITAGTLRFEALETSGGNTGAVEIEVYGEPVP